MTILTSDSSTFNSPDFPRFYPDDLNICWLINSEDHVNLSFKYMWTELNHDFIRIYGGESTSSPLLFELSGGWFAGDKWFLQQIRCSSPSPLIPIAACTILDSKRATPAASCWYQPAALYRHQTTRIVTTIWKAFVGSSVHQKATLLVFHSIPSKQNISSTTSAFSMANPPIRLYCRLLLEMPRHLPSTHRPMQCWSFFPAPTRIRVQDSKQLSIQFSLLQLLLRLQLPLQLSIHLLKPYQWRRPGFLRRQFFQQLVQWNTAYVCWWFFL